MQKFRIAILLPEVIEAIRKQTVEYLDKSIDPVERTTERDEEAFILILSQYKAIWFYKAHSFASVDTAGLEIDFSLIPYARFTELLIETNLFAIEMLGIQIPIIQWNGVECRLDEIPELYTCEPINSAFDGDPTLDEFQGEVTDITLADLGIMDEIGTPGENMAVNLMMKAAFNLHPTGKQQQLPN